MPRGSKPKAGAKPATAVRRKNTNDSPIGSAGSAPQTLRPLVGAQGGYGVFACSFAGWDDTADEGQKNAENDKDEGVAKGKECVDSVHACDRMNDDVDRDEH